MFDFEDWGDVLVMIGAWCLMCLAFPVGWFVLRGEWVFGQMVRSQEGYALFAINWGVALLMPVILRRRRRRRR